MAGVTNYAFRSLCREFGAGLYVSEMITARGFLEGNRAHAPPREQPRRTSRRARCSSTAAIRASVGEAARAARRRGRRPHRHELRLPGAEDHAPRRRQRHSAQATPHGAPRRARRYEGAGGVPVTVKVRKGIDDRLLTYLDAGPRRRGGGRGGDRAPRPHRGAALLGRGRLGRDRGAEGGGRDSRARQRRRLGVLGRAPHAARDRLRRRDRRPRLSPAARGSSPSSPRCSTAASRARSRGSARSSRSCAGTPSGWSRFFGRARACARCGSGAVWYTSGFRGVGRRCAKPSRQIDDARGDDGDRSRASIPRSRSRCRGLRASRAKDGRRAARSGCPTAISTRATTTRRRPPHEDRSRLGSRALGRLRRHGRTSSTIRTATVTRTAATRAQNESSSSALRRVRQRDFGRSGCRDDADDRS